VKGRRGDLGEDSSMLKCLLQIGQGIIVVFPLWILDGLGPVISDNPEGLSRSLVLSSLFL